MTEMPSTRRSLIVKLKDPADTVSWQEFTAVYEPLVLRLARRKGLQEADARDVCQEVLRAVAFAVERWDPERGSFRAWISRITRNLLINFLARGGKVRGSGATSIHDLLLAQPAPDPAATALFEAEYRVQLVHTALEQVRDQFAESTWKAFMRTAIEGRPIDEVARELSLSVGAVYVARSRVLARLKDRLSRLGGEEELGGEVGHDDAR